jgi:hypothetical protein
MRRFAFAVTVAGFAFAAPAAAHHMTVDPPGGGHGTSHWVGGPPGMVLPESAGGAGLHQSPFGAMPAAHSAGPADAKGLVQACESTRANPSVVHFAAPPFFTGCMHGLP